MIRPVTCVCFLLACGSGLYLYQAKHRVNVLDHQIEKTIRATDAIREQIRLLHADWTLLNQPDRLQKLADQFLTLKTTNPAQFTSMAELDSRLPPVPPPEAPAPAPAATPDESAAPAIASASPETTPPTSVAAATSTVAPAPPVRTRIADATPSDHPRTEEPRPNPHIPIHVAVASLPHPVPTLSRIQPRVIEAATRPTWMPRPVQSNAAYVPASAVSGSLLGMARSQAARPAAAGAARLRWRQLSPRHERRTHQPDRAAAELAATADTPHDPQPPARRRPGRRRAAHGDRPHHRARPEAPRRVGNHALRGWW